MVQQSPNSFVGWHWQQCSLQPKPPNIPTTKNTIIIISCVLNQCSPPCVLLYQSWALTQPHWCSMSHSLISLIFALLFMEKDVVCSLWLAWKTLRHSCGRTLQATPLSRSFITMDMAGLRTDQKRLWLQKALRCNPISGQTTLVRKKYYLKKHHPTDSLLN